MSVYASAPWFRIRRNSTPVFLLLQQRLNEIRIWSERIRNFEKTYTTDNGLFFLDCAGIQELLLPKLGSIFKELCTFVADESRNLAESFSHEMEVALDVSKEMNFVHSCL